MSDNSRCTECEGVMKDNDKMCAVKFVSGLGADGVVCYGNGVG